MPLETLVCKLEHRWQRKSSNAKRQGQKYACLFVCFRYTYDIHTISSSPVCAAQRIEWLFLAPASGRAVILFTYVIRAALTIASGIDRHFDTGRIIFRNS